MFASLKNHPFAVDAHFERSLVLTFAVPKRELASLIPECLSLDLFEEQWAFVAVAIVQTKHLRPTGFPAFLGNDFVLIGYRIFVRYTTNAGKRLRGLYILRSETDRKQMEWLGNLFTHYQYTTTDITLHQTGELLTVQSTKSNLTTRVNLNPKTASLPPESPFRDWSAARRFAGPLPFTFSYEPVTKRVLIVEGVRQHWQPVPVSVLDYDVGYLNGLGLNGIRPANAFAIENIPYHWKKGRIEQWNG